MTTSSGRAPGSASRSAAARSCQAASSSASSPSRVLAAATTGRRPDQFTPAATARDQVGRRLEVVLQVAADRIGGAAEPLEARRIGGGLDADPVEARQRRRDQGALPQAARQRSLRQPAVDQRERHAGARGLGGQFGQTSVSTSSPQAGRQRRRKRRQAEGRSYGR